MPGLGTRDFDQIYRAPSRRQRSRRFLVVARRQGPDRGGRARQTRWGISVKAHLGGAVVRNRIKRRVRAILRRAQEGVPAGWDLVVQPRTAEVARAEFAALTRELEALLAAALGPKEKA